MSEGGDGGGRPEKHPLEDHDKRSPVRRGSDRQNPQENNNDDDDVPFIAFDTLGEEEDGGAPNASGVAHRPPPISRSPFHFSRQDEKVFSSDTTMSESYSGFSAHTYGTEEDWRQVEIAGGSNPADVRQLLLQGRARARQQYQQLHGTVHVPSQQPQAKPAPSAAAGAAVSAVHCLSPDRSASSSSSSGKGKSNGSSRSGSGAGKPKLTPRRDSSTSRRSAASSSGTIMPSGQPLTVEQHDTMTEQERRAIAEEVLRRAGGSEAFLRSIMEQRKKEGLL